MLEELVLLCQTFGSGALDTVCHIPAAILVPLRLRSLRTLWPLWSTENRLRIGPVYRSLSDVGTAVALAYEGNPTKVQGEKTLVPRLAQMMKGWRKEDPPNKENCQCGLMYQNFRKIWGWKKMPLEW